MNFMNLKKLILYDNTLSIDFMNAIVQKYLIQRYINVSYKKSFVHCNHRNSESESTFFDFINPLCNTMYVIQTTMIFRKKYFNRWNRSEMAATTLWQQNMSKANLKILHARYYIKIWYTYHRNTNNTYKKSFILWKHCETISFTV